MTREPFVITCPRCGANNVHPIAVEVNRGGAVAIVDHRGVFEHPYGPRSGRGVIITRRYACEAGCLFSLRETFHKGSTSGELVDVATYDPGRESFPTLWRD